MRFLPTSVHGAIDYLWGIVLIALPYLLGFANGGVEQAVLQVLGAGAILYAFFTDYELGVVRLLPMRLHLVIDALGGAFLAASPWILGFSERGPVLPHLLFGLFAVVASVITRTEPGSARS